MRAPSQSTPQGAPQRNPAVRVVVGVVVVMVVTFAAFYGARPADDVPGSAGASTAAAVQVAINGADHRGPSAAGPAAAAAVSGGASVADTTWLRDTLLSLRAMNDTTLCPEHDSPEEVRAAAGKAMCTVAALGMPEVCGPAVPEAGDVLMRCVRRWGYAAMTEVMPSKCRDSVFWKRVEAMKLTGDAGAAAAPDAGVEELLLLGKKGGAKLGPHNRENTIRAQVVEAPSRYKKRRYVPPSERTYRTDVPRRECTGDLNFVARSISFGFPEEAMAQRPLNVSERAWGFFPYLRRYTLKEHVPYRLGEQDEFITQQVYRRSHFVFTHRRGGWDCWRHLEALSAGTPPFMPDLPQCDKLCLALYPKHIMEQVLALPGVNHIGKVQGPHTNGPPPGPDKPTAAPANETYLVIRPELDPPSHANPRRVPDVDFEKLDHAEYMRLAQEGLDWVRKYQTTKAIVSYVLHEAQYEEPKSVLLITRDGMDYLEFTMEHGLAALGINYTVVNQRPFLRHVTYDPASGMPSSAKMDSERTQIHRLYMVHGRGIFYGFRLPHTEQVAAPDAALEARIAAKEFDLVISYHWPPIDQIPMMKTIREHMPKERILFVDGGDNLGGGDSRFWLQEASKVGMIFQRELEVGGGCN